MVADVSAVALVGATVGAQRTQICAAIEEISSYGRTAPTQLTSGLAVESVAVSRAGCVAVGETHVVTAAHALDACLAHDSALRVGGAAGNCAFLDGMGKGAGCHSSSEKHNNRVHLCKANDERRERWKQWRDKARKCGKGANEGWN